MEENDERRVYERNDIEAPIMYSEYDEEYYYGAIMQNCSMDGVYFESDRSLSPGMDIYVKSSNFSADVLGTESTNGYLAEVVWCEELETDEWFSYGIGVQYYEPLQ